MSKEKILTDMLDQIIIDKATSRVTYDEIMESTGLSRQTVCDILNPNKRKRSRFDTIIKVINYFDELKNIKTEDK